MKKKSFTLAEILLVIGILAVVAIMTIPELVTNVTQYTFNTSSAVFGAKLREAANQMNVNDELTGYSTNEQFADAFTKYVKVSKRCDSTNLNKCFVPQFKTGSGQDVITMSDLRTSYDLGIFHNTNPLVGFTLLNGTSFIMAYDPNCAVNPADVANLNIDKTYCMSIVYDVNGASSPNVMAKDIITLNATLTACDARIGSLCLAAGDTAPYSINTCSDTT